MRDFPLGRWPRILIAGIAVHAILAFTPSLHAQKLHVDTTTRLVTYDTLLGEPGRAADVLFDQVNGWLEFHRRDLGTELIFQNRPTRVEATFVYTYHDALSGAVYEHQATFQLEDGYIHVTIDHLATYGGGKRLVDIEFSAVKSNGKLRNGSFFRRFNRKIEEGLRQVIVNLDDYVNGRLQTAVSADSIADVQRNRRIDSLKVVSSGDHFYGRFGLSALVPFDGRGNAWVLPGLTLCFGVRLASTKNAAVILNAPVTAGWLKNTFAGADFPLMLDLAVGSAAANSKASVGLIAGGGIGFLYEQKYRPMDDVHLWGLRSHAGLTFGRSKFGIKSIIFTYGIAAHGQFNRVAGLGIQYIIP